MTEKQQTPNEELWEIILNYITEIDDAINKINEIRRQYVHRFRVFSGSEPKDQVETEQLLAELSKKIAEIE